MKKTFRIFSIECKTICTPSDSYYARSNDWSSDDIQYLKPCSEEFDTEEEAVKELLTYEVGTKLIILPVYTVIDNQG